MEVNYSFPTDYPCNQAVHYKDNKFEVILISSEFQTFLKMPVVNLQRIKVALVGVVAL